MIYLYNRNNNQLRIYRETAKSRTENLSNNRQEKLDIIDIVLETPS